MLIRFSIENFLSFKDKQTFSMLPASKIRVKKHHKTKPMQGISVLRASVIFGANASGKSNLIKAIEFGKLIIESKEPATILAKFNQFKLDPMNKQRNSSIEYEFQHGGKNYAYGFVFNSTQIVEEWLYIISKKGQELIFERTINKEKHFDLSGLFKVNEDQDHRNFLEFFAKSTPKNNLFISEVKNRNVIENVTDITDLQNTIDWFSNTLEVVYPNPQSFAFFSLLKQPKIHEMFNKIFKIFGFGIDGVEFKEIKVSQSNLGSEFVESLHNELLKDKLSNTLSPTNNIIFLSNNAKDQYFIVSLSENNGLKLEQLKTKHELSDGTEVLFDVSEESDGTRRIMELFPLFIHYFLSNKVFIIDELERSIHPKLIFNIFSLLLDMGIETNSQLIVSSHEAQILSEDLLRKDEIWFVDKNNAGESALASLSDYTMVHIKSLLKDYLIGRYKGIPYFADNNEALDLFSTKEEESLK